MDKLWEICGATVHTRRKSRIVVSGSLLMPQRAVYKCLILPKSVDRKFVSIHKLSIWRAARLQKKGIFFSFLSRKLPKFTF